MATTTISNIEDALRELGVTGKTLSAGEKQALDEQGYIVLRDVVDRHWLEELRTGFERVAEQERQEGGKHAKQEGGTRHISSLADKGQEFERVFTHPKLLAAAHHVLKSEFKLGGFTGRDPLPGFGQQGLHTDWIRRQLSDPFQIINSIWMLDDLTPENGATRIVPGTHKLIQVVPKGMANPDGHHPQEQFVTAPAGSVLIFNSHLWHSGMRNNSSRSRRVLLCNFVRSDNVGYMSSQTEVFSSTIDDLVPAVRYLIKGV